MRHRISRAHALRAAFVAGTAVSLASGLAGDPARNEVGAALRALVEDGNTPGLQYVHEAPAGGFHFEAGLQDVSSGMAVDQRTTFMAFSVTKTLTALAILQLAQSGKISLDDPVSMYVDGFPYKENPTIRQTLNHRGGFPNPIPLAWSHLEGEHASFNRRDFLRSVLAENSRLKGSPGEDFAYSNVGYLVLGEVIEKASGQPYEEYIQKNILDRLQFAPGEVLTFRLPENGQATGYLKRWSLLNLVLGWLVDRDRFIAGSQGSWNSFRRYYVNGPAYGGLIGNASGFARYLRTLVDSSGPFNREIRQIVSGAVDADSPVSLGWYTGTLNGHPYFAHAGGGGGYYCEIRFYPELRRRSVIMLNRTGVSDERLLDRIDALHVGSHEAEN